MAGEEPIVVRGELERDDLVAAYLLAERPRRLKLRLLVTLMGAFLFFLDWVMGLGAFSVIYCQVVGGLLVAYGLFGADLVFVGRVRSILKKDPEMIGRQIYMAFGEEGMVPEAGSGLIIDYAKLHGWRQDGMTFLVFFKPERWFPVPKRMVEGERLAELGGLLTAKLGKPGGLFRS